MTISSAVAPTEGDAPAGTRCEHDLLGYLDVPADAYYGVHTARAADNFPITGIRLEIYPIFINALAAVKQAAAVANRAIGAIGPGKADAIIAAAADVRAGCLHDQFAVDMIQGGAGTSTNMNANEVIANRALEHLGHSRGEYQHLHPLQDVNLGQSTNDVYPTAINIALDTYVVKLDAALGALHDAFLRKASDFADVVKIARTQLQDAVPMTLGQEFNAFASTLAEDRQRLQEARMLLHELNLGGTAIGTELNAHPDYRRHVIGALREITGIPTLSSASDLVEATSDVGHFVQLSGVLKRVAVKLSKICNDLRLLSSGPRAGFGEINLPARQAGSSIMPGKVNPVIPEVVNQVAFEVLGNDVTVTMAAESGQLQLNAFEPIIAHSLFASLDHLAAAAVVLADKCIDGITANRDLLRSRVANSIGLVTALSPVIGYENATDVAQEALVTGRGVAEIVEQRELLSRDRIKAILATVGGRSAAPGMSAPTGAAAPAPAVRPATIGEATTAGASARAASRDVELARVYRSGLREGSHYGALVVVDRDGSVLWHRGDVHRPVFQRSCAKPFQAVAMLNAGAQISGPDLALAAASHTGEHEHVVRVLDLLKAGRVTEQDLGCPADLPTDRAARDAVIRAGGRPRRVYMTCSGKHAAMLGTCRAAGWPTADYLAPEHPLQHLIRSTIADLTGETCGDTVGVDGCGAPVFATGLVGLARGFGALVSAPQGTARRSVADAMRVHPRMVGGSDSPDTLLMTAHPGLLAKGGADGVHALALPDGRAVAFKIADGGDRARLPIIAAALGFLGVEAASRPGSATAVLGGGRPVGAVTVAPDLFR